MRVLVGVDWGSGSHAVCMIDAEGQVLDRLEAGHDRAGAAALILRLMEYGVSGDIPVAIERPSGLLVDTLVEAGFVATPIHPDVVQACRPRYRAVSAESDPGDASILADILRTDGRHRLTALKPQSDAIEAQCGQVRDRDDLVSSRVASDNQLRALPDGFWPGATVTFADPADFVEIRSPITLAFIERYPTPESVARLGPERLAGCLARRHSCGRKSPRRCWRVCRPRAEDALAKPRALPRQRDRQDQQLHRAHAHRAARRPDRHVLPQGRRRLRRPDPRRAGRRARALPERRPARRRGRLGVGWRWACNKRRRAAVTCFADNSRHQSPWAADVQNRARARGCDHPHAIRILGRARARVRWRAWANGEPYDPAKHAGAKPFPAALGPPGSHRKSRAARACPLLPSAIG